MKKQLEAIFLLSGTAIGSGMLSLPLVLANFGIIYSILITLFFSWVTYITAIVRSDLNIHSKADNSLKDVGLTFSGKYSGLIGDISIKLLSLSLLSAYIFGISSVIGSIIGISDNKTFIIFLFSIFTGLIISTSSNRILKINKNAFILMMLTFIMLVISLIFKIDVKSIPLNCDGIKNISNWCVLIPIIFTSFGFQGSIHSMTKLVNNDKKLIKKACLFGSIIPAIVYIIWISAILTITFNIDINFFNSMLKGDVEVGELVKILGKATDVKFIQITFWIISILSILTSIIGIALSLTDILKKELEKKIIIKKIRNIIAILLIIVPPTIVAIIVPNAFIRVLNFAGIILSIIAIILPIFLYTKLKKIKNNNDDFLIKNNIPVFLVLLCGILIVISGIIEVYFNI